MNSLTRYEKELSAGNKRIHQYLTGGSRPVLISRAIVGALLLVISVMLWWQGLGD